jgi:hypothetical protein
VADGACAGAGGDCFNRAVIFRVESGRIQSAPPGASGFVSASRDALFKELRALQ